MDIEARVTDRLTDGLTLSFFFPRPSPRPAQCPYNAIQLLFSQQSRSSTLSPISPDKVRAHPLVAAASSIIQPEREATGAQSLASAGSLGDILELWWDGGALAAYVSMHLQQCIKLTVDMSRRPKGALLMIRIVPASLTCSLLPDLTCTTSHRILMEPDERKDVLSHFTKRC